MQTSHRHAVRQMGLHAPVADGLLPHWLREVARVRTGERTVYMAPQSEWVLSDLGRAAPHERF